MGLVYFTFIALYKDEGPRGGGDTKFTKDTPTSTEDALEEARRIMEKYKWSILAHPISLGEEGMLWRPIF